MRSILLFLCTLVVTLGTIALQDCPSTTSPPHRSLQDQLCRAFHLLHRVESTPDTPLAHTPIRRVAWNPEDGPFTATTVFATYAEPVVFTNTYIQKEWKAVGTWTPASLAKRHPDTWTLPGTYIKPRHPSQPRGKFGPIWTEFLPMAKLPDFEWQNSHSRRDFTFAQLIQAIHAQKRWVYYVGAIETLSEAVLDDIHPALPLFADPQRSIVNVWIGQPGVVAHLHYDSYYNFNVQLTGSKRFLLYPPTAWPQLRPYPNLHPSYGQCMRDLDGDLNDMPHVGKEPIPAIEAILQPGDVLYVPPLWSHQVEALPGQPSVNVNVWSPFEDTEALQIVTDDILEAMQEFLRVALEPTGCTAKDQETRCDPVDGLLCTRIRAGHDVVKALLQKSEWTVPSTRETEERVSVTPLEWLERVVRARFDPLIAQGKLPGEIPDALAARCARVDKNRSDRASLVTHVRRAFPRVGKRMHQALREARRVLAGMKNDSHRNLLVPNLVEGILFWSLAIPAEMRPDGLWPVDGSASSQAERDAAKRLFDEPSRWVGALLRRIKS